jgi:two-component system, chemotaxis family, CheB/CheR fusion protein
MPPFSSPSLVCRNTLMYFNAETQAQILRRFHFGLDDEGYLLLGKSEMLIAHTELFAPVELKRRVFREVIKPTLRDRVRVVATDGARGQPVAEADNLREAAFDIVGAAHIVLDHKRSMIMANDAARGLFGLGIPDFGQPIQDLELSYGPIELRSHLDSLDRDMRPSEIKAVHWRTRDSERIFDIRLTPLISDGVTMGTSIAHIDLTEAHRLQDQLTSSKRELEQAYEELQSTVEELETTNEELQSANEELETMNEGLRHRTDELNDVNAFLETILVTIGLAVAVLDRNQRVQIWNSNARELWGLTAEEAEDEHLLALDIGLPVDKLRQQVRDTLTGRSQREEVIVEATNRRGKPFTCRVTLLPLGNTGDGAVSGVIMMMEDVVSSARPE